MTLAFLLLTACESPGIRHPLAAQAEPSPQSTPSPSPEPTLPQQTPTPEPLQDTVQISLKDFRLEPDEVVAVKAGTVTFVLQNEGRYTHDFRVKGQGIDEKAPKVGRGRTREWQVTLTPGTYRISCPISNHADRGMTGTLTVVE
ncbi:MAG: cupredoxin domain-containing protein [Dehalococcoidia bacterium]